MSNSMSVTRSHARTVKRVRCVAEQRECIHRVSFSEDRGRKRQCDRSNLFSAGTEAIHLTASSPKAEIGCRFTRSAAAHVPYLIEQP
jgi:hypothetical protein